jgi:hypothetical protein
VGSAGDAEFAVVVTRINHTPAFVGVDFARPAYLTVVLVTPERIMPMLPVLGKRSEIIGAGEQVVGMGVTADSAANSLGQRFRGTQVAETPSASALMEYNRCMARAESASKARRTVRKQVGTDKDGKPIYVTEELPDLDRTVDRACRLPSAETGALRGPTGIPSQSTGSTLLVFASDTPVDHQDIVNLAVSESGARAIAQSIGNKLFASRGAKWSVTFVPW